MKAVGPENSIFYSIAAGLSLDLARENIHLCLSYDVTNKQLILLPAFLNFKKNQLHAFDIFLMLTLNSPGHCRGSREMECRKKNIKIPDYGVFSVPILTNS